jgi:hypothetical protein
MIEYHVGLPRALINSSSHFIGLAQTANNTHWLKSFERSIYDFIPILPAGGTSLKAGVLDYIIKL